MMNEIISDGYIPFEEEEYMNPRQLEYFRDKLLQWKRELLEGSKKAMQDLAAGSLNESDMTDRANMELETFCELNNRDRHRKLISKIDDALHRIDTGEYGYCEETGAKIGVKRLQARLIATLCIEAQEAYERYKKQYNEDEDEE